MNVNWTQVAHVAGKTLQVVGSVAGSTLAVIGAVNATCGAVNQLTNSAKTVDTICLGGKGRETVTGLLGKKAA